MACTKSGAAKDDNSDKKDGAADQGSSGGDGAGEEGEEDINTDHYMVIRSEVMVELYTTNDEGVREFKEWEEAVGIGGDFPFAEEAT